MQTYNLKNSDHGVTSVILNRPERHNAFDDTMIAELIELLGKLEQDDRVRILVLRAAGKSFSAGADLNWMRRMADYSLEQNQHDAMQLSELMRRLNCFPKPVIALVQGDAYGGGVGLIACCDIAIASSEVTFCLSEVKLGLIPAVISPYVIEAMGARVSRRYMLSAERFSAEQAMGFGLLHEVVGVEELDSRLDSIVEFLLAAGPAAQAAAKDLIHAVSERPIDNDLIQNCASRIARIRASSEGREGLSAFLEKRKPNWCK
jgi:methylglutaconyl-CoA hydratase